jgi:hypothetical protein
MHIIYAAKKNHLSTGLFFYRNPNGIAPGHIYMAPITATDDNICTVIVEEVKDGWMLSPQKSKILIELKRSNKVIFLGTARELLASKILDGDNEEEEEKNGKLWW